MEIGGKHGTGACMQFNRKNELGDIKDESMLIAYLSTPETEIWQGDYLLHVIQDIVRSDT